MERKTQARVATWGYLVVVFAGLVAANAIGHFWYKRWDTTETERFSLSKGSARLVREGLKQDLKIQVYATKGLVKNQLFIKELGDLLKEYQDASVQPDGKPRLTYEIIDPKSKELQDQAKAAGLSEQNFVEGAGAGSTNSDAKTFARGFMGMVFKYGMEQDNIPYWPPSSETTGLEFFITNKIRELRDTVEDRKMKIGIVTGKDELKLTDNVIAPSQPGQDYNLKGIFKQYLPFYDFEDVDLQNGDAEINQELKGLIITQPAKDYTDKELRRIDQFMMLGNRSLVVFASAVNLKPSDASMRATLSTHGLEKLLDGYGIEMKRDAIFDWTGAFGLPLQLDQDSPPKIIPIPWAVQLQPNSSFDGDKELLDRGFPAFFRMDQVPVPFASTLVLHKDKQPQIRTRVVGRTYPDATAETSDNVDMSLNKMLSNSGATGEKAQRVIAVALEPACCDGKPKCGDDDPCKKGILNSAFSGDNMGVEAPAQSKGPASVFVVSSAQFLANPFARSGNPPPMPPQMAMMGGGGGDRDLQTIARFYYKNSFPWMVMSFKNTLDWMGGEQDLVATSAKLLGAAPLRYSDIKKPDIKAEDSDDDRKKKEDAYNEQRNSLQTKVELTLIILPVVLFIVFGIVRWRLREASRNSVSI
ncbi:MAG: GldG family protein [Polyangiaceae bacterium]